MPDFLAGLLTHGGGWPAGVDPDFGKAALETAQARASVLPHTIELHTKSDDYRPSVEDLGKRLNGEYKSKLEWWAIGPKLGSVFDEAANGIQWLYSPHIRHSFSNQPYSRKYEL